ncbi:MAG: MFS transporter [Steroidobacteraceae bacterium]
MTSVLGGAADAAATGFNGHAANRRYAWYAVSVLTLVQVVSYIDRFLPSLLIADIKRDLALSDFQVGLLLGPAFGLFYVFVGVPLGWLADRVSRRGLLSAGIVVWCAMTTAAAFARGFFPLFGTRLGVGLGEAVVAPCSIALVNDYFPRRESARAISLFMAGTFIGAGSAFLFGGPIVHAIAALPPLEIPGVGFLRPWQMAFAMIGLPGLLLSLLVFTVREPLRQDRIAGLSSEAKPSLRVAVGYVCARWRAFGTLFFASATVTCLSALAFWNVAVFERNWGWNVREVGIATGLLYFIGGPIGTMLGVHLMNRGLAQSRPDATLRALLVGLFIAVPAFALYAQMPTGELAIACLLIAFIGQALATAAGPSSLSLIAPGQIRSQSVALYYLVIGVFGQLLGPPPVGLLTDLLGDPSYLRHAMTLEAAVLGSAALVVVAMGMRHFRAASHELEIAGAEPVR